MVAFPYHVMVLFSQRSEEKIVVMPRTVFAAMLMYLGTGCASAPPAAPPPVEARPMPSTVRPTPVAMTLSIQLVDGKSRAILAGATATVKGAANGRSWEGRADAEGGVHVPADIVDDEMTVTVKGYRPATVRRNTGRRPKRVVTVRLVPM
jgi:hypothetical protein